MFIFDQIMINVHSYRNLNEDRSARGITMHYIKSHNQMLECKSK